MRILNYIFLFFSIVFFLVVDKLGLFSNFNLLLIILYFNSIFLIANKNLNYILKGTMYIISFLIFLYLLWLIIIHSALSPIDNNFSAYL
ncbi:MAG: hypothetical protein CMC40_07590 [Flavobacteriaceae bacterium]|nr:hypothetical protein [Flavobacteriaceae bacterium]